MVNIVSNEKVRLTMMKSMASMFFMPKREVHYIGGADILPSPLEAEEEKRLLDKLGTLDDTEVKSVLIEHNLRLVVYIAKKFDNTGVGVEDLISIGTIGLIKAINTFKADKKIKLATYASRCIENEILMYLRRSAKTKMEVSIDEPLNVDWDGNELLLSDILGTEEDLIYNHVQAGTGNYIAYFQAYTNTYAPIEKLHFLFEQALSDPLFGGIAIATRADCLSDEVIGMLKELKQEHAEKLFLVELGLQTIHEKSALFIRRGYPLSVFDDCTERLCRAGIPFVVHVILGLPNESKEMMLETVWHVNEVHASGIKLQLLHYLSDTDLGRMYSQNPELFHVLSEEEYVDIVCCCIGNLCPDIVIHRLTGDGNGENLLAPLWSRNKKHVLNAIRHELKIRNITQGSLMERNQI